MLPRNIILIPMTLFFFFFSACGIKIAGKNGPPDRLENKDIHYETQVVLGECVCTPKPQTGLIASIFAGAAINGAINYFGKVLDSSAKTDTQSVMSSRNFGVTAKGFGPCLQVARGWFWRKKPDEVVLKDFKDWAKEYFKAVPGSGVEEEMSDEERGKARALRLTKNGLWLAAPPDFFFEGHFSIIDYEIGQAGKEKVSAQAYAFLPSAARMDEPIGMRPLRISKKREMLVSVAFHGPGESPNLEKNPAATISLRTMKPGAWKTWPTGNNVLHPRGEGKGLDTYPPWESSWFEIALSKKITPLTATMIVSETQSASEFLSFIAGIYSQAQPGLSEALQQKFVPTKIEETGTAKLKELNKAASAYDYAIAALCACAEAQSDKVSALAAEAKNKMRESNLMQHQTSDSAEAKKFGPELIDAINPGDENKEKIKNACKAAIK
jgi:hypothetical protein